MSVKGELSRFGSVRIFYADHLTTLTDMRWMTSSKPMKLFFFIQACLFRLSCDFQLPWRYISACILGAITYHNVPLAPTCWDWRYIWWHGLVKRWWNVVAVCTVAKSDLNERHPYYVPHCSLTSISHLSHSEKVIPFARHLDFIQWRYGNIFSTASVYLRNVLKLFFSSPFSTEAKNAEVTWILLLREETYRRKGSWYGCSALISSPDSSFWSEKCCYLRKEGMKQNFARIF